MHSQFSLLDPPLCFWVFKLYSSRVQCLAFLSLLYLNSLSKLSQSPTFILYIPFVCWWHSHLSLSPELQFQHMQNKTFDFLPPQTCFSHLFRLTFTQFLVIKTWFFPLHHLSNVSKFDNSPIKYKLDMVNKLYFHKSPPSLNLCTPCPKGWYF